MTAVVAAVRTPAVALEEATAAAMPAALTDGLGTVTEADTTGEAGLELRLLIYYDPWYYGAGYYPYYYGDRLLQL